VDFYLENNIGIYFPNKGFSIERQGKPLSHKFVCGPKIAFEDVSDPESKLSMQGVRLMYVSPLTPLNIQTSTQEQLSPAANLPDEIR
jgi:hypothetical protein